MSLIGVHHVSLTVRDLDRSAAWYRDTFGFVELFREHADDRRACVMRFADGGVSVGLVEHPPATDVPFDVKVVGLDHAAFTVATRADMDRWAADLTAAGVEHSGVIDLPVGAILNCKDPDGIALALFWDQD